MVRLYRLFFLLIIVTFVSCEKDTSDRLQGKWQLQTIETKQGQTQVVDTFFYNFDKGVVVLMSVELDKDRSIQVPGRFSANENELKLDFPGKYAEALHLFNWTDSVRYYKILELTNKKLILERNTEILRLRKF